MSDFKQKKVLIVATFKDACLPKHRVKVPSSERAVSEVAHIARAFAGLQSIVFDDLQGRHVFNGQGAYFFTIPPSLLAMAQ